MFDNVIEMYHEFMAGEYFSMIMTALVGLLMGWISYKVAGWFGIKGGRQQAVAVAGFFTLGLALFVFIPGILIYKWYLRGKKE